MKGSEEIEAAQLAVSALLDKENGSLTVATPVASSPTQQAAATVSTALGAPQVPQFGFETHAAGSLASTSLPPVLLSSAPSPSTPCNPSFASSTWLRIETREELGTASSTVRLHFNPDSYERVESIRNGRRRHIGRQRCMGAVTFECEWDESDDGETALSLPLDTPANVTLHIDSCSNSNIGVHLPFTWLQVGHRGTLLTLLIEQGGDRRAYVRI